MSLKRYNFVFSKLKSYFAREPEQNTTIDHEKLNTLWTDKVQFGTFEQQREVIVFVAFGELCNSVERIKQINCKGQCKSVF